MTCIDLENKNNLKTRYFKFKSFFSFIINIFNLYHDLRVEEIKSI